MHAYDNLGIDVRLGGAILPHRNEGLREMFESLFFAVGVGLIILISARELLRRSEY